MTGGVYSINADMLDAYKTCTYSNHASNLGALLADFICSEREIPGYIVDPVTTDEFKPAARLSGVPGMERKCRSHALNIKYCAVKAVNDLGESHHKYRFIVAHLGSGFSIAAVENGRIIDVNDALLGMGPFSVERAGALPIQGLLDLVFKKGLSEGEIKTLLSKNSGLRGYLGTADFREIENRLDEAPVRLVYEAMLLQIIKEIGAQYAAFGGDVDGLILTGGLCYSAKLVQDLKTRLSFISEIFVYAGSYELEALAESVLRVIKGDQKAQVYT